MEQGGCHCKITPKGRDHGLRQRAHEADRRPRRAEGLDFLIAIEILSSAIADCARVIAEHLVESGNIVRNDRSLITIESFPYLRNNFGNIDLHLIFSYIS